MNNLLFIILLKQTIWPTKEINVLFKIYILVIINQNNINNELVTFLNHIIHKPSKINFRNMTILMQYAVMCTLDCT